MLKKLPACEPCRAQKLACDHARPVCRRCLDREEPEGCTYRPRPFKRSAARRQRQATSGGSARGMARGVVPMSSAEGASYPAEASRGHEAEVVGSNGHGPEWYPSDNAGEPRWDPQPACEQQDHSHAQPIHYPNPGYLGMSSYTNLFNQVQLENLEAGPHCATGPSPEPLGSGANMTPDSGPVTQPAVDDDDINAGARLIIEISRLPVPLAAYADLVRGWIANGANLAVVADLIECCMGATLTALSSFDKTHVSARAISKSLFAQSRREVVTTASTTIDDYRRNVASPNARWETLGFFFTALCRATTDMGYANALYDDQKQRCRLQKLALDFSDRCLDLALSLDCLNDLQLFLQYENFISHSQTDGDQSYRSWRKLGDVASSLYALGYHQDTGSDNCPSFLWTLRQMVLGRAYSADKNVSIFLGRPPRILRKSCHPNNIVSLAARTLPATTDVFELRSGFGYVADSRWFLICAVLKERILSLFDEVDAEARSREAQLIYNDLESHWSSLPPSYRLNCDLKACHRRPIERDFLVGAKLNYLHTHFLLRSALVSQTSEPDPQLLRLSVDMLSLVVEAVIFKDQLVNSGTSLVWKVVYYGLAAAGVLCLTLISRPTPPPVLQENASGTFQDLSVLVAEVERGTLVYVEHPNYALLSRATGTIQSLIGRLLANSFMSAMPPFVTRQQQEQQQQRPQDYQEPFVDPQLEAAIAPESWDPWERFNGQDFELNFWLSLADHPFLTS